MIGMHSSSSLQRHQARQPLAAAPPPSSWIVDTGTTNEKGQRPARYSSFFSPGQAFALAAICASVAAILTGSFALHFFERSVGTDPAHLYSDHLLTSTTRSLISRTRLRSPNENSVSSYGQQTSYGFLNPTATASFFFPSMKTSDREMKSTDVERFHLSHLPTPQVDDTGPRPHVVWLMSFPNSGTSFTLHLTREATNCTTATNYALEGDIKDEPSVPAITGQAGEKGPFLELIPNRTTTLPESILTKTHCEGYCSSCKPHKIFHTVRSFMVGCLTGTRAIRSNEGSIDVVDVTYDRALVKKAIHLFRHPLDNIVARFHLELREKGLAGDEEFGKRFPKNATGFHLWCASEDSNRVLLESRFIDELTRIKMLAIPCRNDFYRYVQWHNLAFDTTRFMNIPTMILHYHEYSQDFEATRDRVLEWVGVQRIAEGERFQSGKIYRHYYTPEQKAAIHSFLRETASAETWIHIRDYDFEMSNAAEV